MSGFRLETPPLMGSSGNLCSVFQPSRCCLSWTFGISPAQKRLRSQIKDLRGVYKKDFGDFPLVVLSSRDFPSLCCCFGSPSWILSPDCTGDRAVAFRLIFATCKLNVRLSSVEKSYKMDFFQYGSFLSGIKSYPVSAEFWSLSSALKLCFFVVVVCFLFLHFIKIW